MTQRRVRFEYWTDPMCIWAFVAEPKLTRVLEEVGTHLEVDYRIVPVFGSVTQRLRDGGWAKEGREGRRSATKKVAVEHGHPDVTGDVWVHDTPTSSWAVGAAAKAAFLAEAAGAAPGGAGAAYLWALRERFFVHDQNTCRREVQLSVAEQVGIDPEAIERRLDDGSALAALAEDDELRRERRVQGSPSYVFDGGRTVLYGNFAWPILCSTVSELLQGIGIGASPC
ncbi:MAG: DsbA family protein [Myxococcales bacterium]|nr:DsbA family protein [Myxococcales bacterium]